MPEYNFNFDWNRISTLGKVKVLVEQVVGQPSQEAITQAVEDYIEAHPGSLSPLSPAVKSALLQIAEKVAYINENGQDYYDALDAALSAKALLQITAVYTQSGTVYTTDTLDSLKSDLVVTAYYDDGTSADVTSACTLSGTLTKGTSTITATYSGKSATFTVTVALAPQLYALPTPTTFTGSNYVDTGVKLLETDRDFTLCMEFVNGTYLYNSLVFDCRRTTSDPGGGMTRYGCMMFTRSQGYYALSGMTVTYPGNDFLATEGKTLKLVIRHKTSDSSWTIDGLVDGVRKAQTSSTTSKTIVTVPNELRIGAPNQDGTGAAWHGTMNTFEVYDGHISDSAVTDWLGA